MDRGETTGSGAWKATVDAVAGGRMPDPAKPLCPTVADLMRVSPDAMCAVDLDGVVIAWGPVCESVYGWSATDVVGELFPGLSRAQRRRYVAEIGAVATTGESVSCETERLRRDGSRFILRVTIVPLLDETGECMGVVDIGTSVLGDDRLRSLHEEFVALVSDEIRGPLSAVLGYAQLLTRPEILGDASCRARTVTGLEERAEQITRMIDDLHVVAEMHGGQPPRTDEVDLAAVVGEVAAGIDRFDGIGIVMELSHEAMCVRGDRRWLGRAVECLVSHALRSAQPAGEVALRLHAEGDSIVFEAGCGRHVREADEGSQAATVSGRESRMGARDYLMPHRLGGIGLHLAERVAAAHEGTVENVGEGDPAVSLLRLRLPALATG